MHEKGEKSHKVFRRRSFDKDVGIGPVSLFLCKYLDIWKNQLQSTTSRTRLYLENTSDVCAIKIKELIPPRNLQKLQVDHITHSIRNWSRELVVRNITANRGTRSKSRRFFDFKECSGEDHSNCPNKQPLWWRWLGSIELMKENVDVQCRQLHTAIAA